MEMFFFCFFFCFVLIAVQFDTLYVIVNIFVSYNFLCILADNAQFQITVLVRFGLVLFWLFTVLLIV